MPGKTLFIIGEVVGVHGLKGNMKVRSYAESIETYKPGVKVKLKSSGKEDGTWYKIARASNQSKGVLLSLQGVEDVNDAQSLKGKEIFVKREDLPEPEENNYFWEDLIGLEVFDKKQGALGKIDSIIETGANDVFVVKSDKDIRKGVKEVLVPAIESVIIAVNIKEGTMEIDLPKGL
jgi:16S rRNA processing protein RimM